MKQLIGYILAGVGLVTLAVSSPKFTATVPILSSLPDKTLLVVGAALVVGGIVVLMQKGSRSSSVKQAQVEVPIYEGTGKNRKIVGYQKA